MNEIILDITIPLRVISKKNSPQLVNNRTRIIPSKQFLIFKKNCKPYLQNLIKTPIDYGVSLELEVVLDNWIIPDHVNICQSICDILQDYNIIEDDKYITIVNNPNKHWLLGKNSENPSTRIILRRFPHPREEYWKNKK